MYRHKQFRQNPAGIELKGQLKVVACFRLWCNLELFASKKRCLLLRLYCDFQARDTVCFTNTFHYSHRSHHWQSAFRACKRKHTRSTEKKAWHFTLGFCCSYRDRGIVDQQRDDLEKSARFCGELISCPFHVSRRLEKLIQFCFLIVYIAGSYFVCMYFSLQGLIEKSTLRALRCPQRQPPILINNRI